MTLRLLNKLRTSVGHVLVLEEIALSATTAPCSEFALPSLILLRAVLYPFQMNLYTYRARRRTSTRQREESELGALNLQQQSDACIHT